jgi:hypothetical protein
MKFNRFIFIVLIACFFEFCVAQPFTPVPLGGKTKKQNLIFPVPPTTTVTGCTLEIGATNATTTNGVTTVSIGTTGTKTTSQFTAKKDGTLVTTTTVWESSDISVATISAAGLVTAVKAGSTKVGPACDPSTRITVNVVTGQAANILEIKTSDESTIQIEPEKNKDIQNED